MLFIQGKPPILPTGCLWWRPETIDDQGWARCALEQPGSKPKRFWPAEEPPNMENLHTLFGPGWYRICWHGKDKRQTLGVSEPFGIVDLPNAPAAAIADVVGCGVGTDGIVLPPALRAPVALGSPQQPETALQHFIMIYSLVGGMVNEQLARVDREHERAMAFLMQIHEKGLQMTADHFAAILRLKEAETAFQSAALEGIPEDVGSTPASIQQAVAGAVGPFSELLATFLMTKMQAKQAPGAPLAGDSKALQGPPEGA